MADPDFHRDQRDRLRDRHVGPINDFVDSLRDKERRGWIPYLAPLHGGVEARVLSVLRDPGSMTQEVRGSSFLSIENDDPTAERQCELFGAVGVTPHDITPWNAYPWYINRKPIAAELDAGAAVLRNLLELLPNLKIVLLQGNEAHSVWERTLKLRATPQWVRELEVAQCVHPSPQGLWTADPAERAERVRRQRHAYQQVGDALG